MRCAAKVKHSTEQDAYRAVRAGKRKGAKLRPYRCDVCGSWHLTSSWRQ